MTFMGAQTNNDEDQCLSGCATGLIGRVIFIIVAPLVGVALYEELKVNQQNIEKLDNFTIINECADQYTNIDIVQVDSELDIAREQAHVIFLWFWITFGMLFLEFFAAFVYLFILLCKGCWSGAPNGPFRGESYDKFERIDESNEFRESMVVVEAADKKHEDPEAAFLANHNNQDSNQPVYGNAPQTYA